MMEELKRIIGLDPAEPIELIHTAEDRFLAVELDEATSLLLENHPELREQTLMVERARQGITQAQSRSYLQVGLFGTSDQQPEFIIHPLGEV